MDLLVYLISARASERASQVNMKRESKAYSFKEQKIDLEIKQVSMHLPSICIVEEHK